MNDFWAGSLLGFGAGFVASVLANKYTELAARYRAYRHARRLAGTWEAYKISGRTVDTTPMKGAGLTVVSSKRHWWSVNSAVLDVYSQDLGDPPRQHDGHIVIDPVSPWLATRIDRYLDSHELSQQRLVIGADFNIVYLFYVADVATLGPVYANHAWRRKC